MFNSSLEKITSQLKKSLDQQFDGFNREIFDLNKKVDELKTENTQLKNGMNEIKKNVMTNKDSYHELLSKLNEVEQEKLTNELILVSSSTNLNENVFTEYVNHNNENPIQINDIKISKKFNNKNKNGKTSYILLTKNKDIRKSIFKSKRNLKSKNIDVFESLTKINQELLTEARKHYSNKLIHSAWSFNGYIYLKKTDTSEPKRIKSLMDIHKYLSN